MLKTLGNVIRDSRNNKSLNIQEASERLNLSRTTLVKLEGNQTILITIDHLIDISNILEVDFLKLINVCKKRLINIELKSIFNVSEKIIYGNTLIDSLKLEKLIKENINNLKIIRNQE